MNSRRPESGGRNVSLVDLAASEPRGLHFERDEYFRDVLRGLKPGASIHLPTPWGLWSLKMEADGRLEVYMASHGPVHTIHVAPKVTNIVEIIPVRV